MLIERDMSEFEWPRTVLQVASPAVAERSDPPRSGMLQTGLQLVSASTLPEEPLRAMVSGWVG